MFFSFILISPSYKSACLPWKPSPDFHLQGYDANWLMPSVPDLENHCAVLASAIHLANVVVLDFGWLKSNGWVFFSFLYVCINLNYKLCSFLESSKVSYLLELTNLVMCCTMECSSHSVSELLWTVRSIKKSNYRHFLISFSCPSLNRCVPWMSWIMIFKHLLWKDGPWEK